MNSQSFSWEWAKNAISLSGSYGQNISVDSDNNSYVIGNFSGSSFSLDSVLLTNAGNQDIFIAKYNVVGQLLWAKSIGGPADDYGCAISNDSIGNIYIVGYYVSGNFSIGNTTLTNAGHCDLFIAKLDSLGNFIWAKSAGGTNCDAALTVQADNRRGVIIGGCFYSNEIIIGGDTLFNAGGYDVFFARYDVSGNVQWAKGAGGIYDDKCRGISTDSKGNIILEGEFESASIIFDSISLTNAGNFIAKSDSMGNLQWAKNSRDAAATLGGSITCDLNNNCYVTGCYAGNHIVFGNDTLFNVNSGSTDVFIVKYDELGNVLWTRNVGGTSYDYSFCIVCDQNSNITLAGVFNSQTLTFNPSTTLYNLDNTGNSSDIFISRYSTSGDFLATQQIGTAYEDAVNGLANDPQGNIWVTGGFNGSSILFGTDTLINPNSTNTVLDFFVAKSELLEGMEEIENEMLFNLYPNPASDEIIISSNKMSDDFTVNVFDVLGRNILNRKYFSGEIIKINTSSFEDGIYFLSVQTASGKTFSQKKIIIQH